MSFTVDKIRSFFANIFSMTGEPSSLSGKYFLWDDISQESKKLGKEKIRLNGKYLLISNIHQPSIIAFLPTKNISTGAAMIIAPGGGHSDLWIKHEGYQPAQWFCEHGIACFVLKYRLAMDVNSNYTVNGHALTDIQRAIRFVRSNGSAWGINKDAIGVMGFSAGGELAGLAAIHFDLGKENPADEIDKQSSYPDFQALIYPSDTRNFEVAKNSPPAFLLAGEKDTEIADDITVLYSKYRDLGIPASLEIYKKVDHGFGVQKTNTGEIARWPNKFLEWLSANGFLKK